MLRWVDGRPEDRLSITDRGLAYGDGLFETISVADGRAPLLDAHIARLSRGCSRLSIPMDAALIRGEVERFAVSLGNGVAKLMITRGEGQRGYAHPVPCKPRRLLIASLRPQYPPENGVYGVRLYECRTRLAEQPLLAGLKHLNRLEQVMARAEWSDPVFAEGLMRDVSGRVIEGVFSNLFVVEGHRLLTPSLERCGVEGVMRASLVEAVRANGDTCEMVDLSLERMLRASEVFVCNSVYGIWPVTHFGEVQWPVGPVTRRMQSVARQLMEVEA